MPESKNTSKARGSNCESIAKNYFQARGFEVTSQNAKYFGTEIDLVLSHKEGYVLLVEVKSLKNPNLWHFRLSQKQKRRLLRVHKLWVERWNRPVGLILALVTSDNQVVEVPILGNH